MSGCFRKEDWCCAGANTREGITLSGGVNMWQIAGMALLGCFIAAFSIWRYCVIWRDEREASMARALIMGGGFILLIFGVLSLAIGPENIDIGMTAAGSMIVAGGIAGIRIDKGKAKFKWLVPALGGIVLVFFGGASMFS
ncbi:hypothetical protein KKD19_04955 [Patescibacteria group bacterium]|nr:hypothetical protein [Patescibacteria group bacterium]MBU4512559.1 hypothetical protein [Patescibacteria group bacterium]MCG2693055.1 hypothetical protein [Candidatus Parcubacteria bacterium]